MGKRLAFSAHGFALALALVGGLSASTFSGSIARAQAAPTLQAQAEQAYNERDYTPAGIQRSQDAANLYAQVAAAATDSTAKAQALTRQSEALYFVGNATSNDNALTLARHLEGNNIADQAVKLLGIADVSKVTDADVDTLKTTLPAPQLAMLGDALYLRGINLGQWGAANGVASSLSKWPELRDNMLLIVKLGLKDLHAYGAYRTLGRGFFKLPGLLGGDNKKAEKYLQTAVSSTLSPGQIYSVHGYNTTYYADVLKANGQNQKAKDLLEAFAKADVTTLEPSLIPENKKAQNDAIEALKNW